MYTRLIYCKPTIIHVLIRACMYICTDRGMALHAVENRHWRNSSDLQPQPWPPSAQTLHDVLFSLVRTDIVFIWI